MTLDEFKKRYGELPFGETVTPIAEIGNTSLSMVASAIYKREQEIAEAEFQIKAMLQVAEIGLRSIITN